MFFVNRIRIRIHKRCKKDEHAWTGWDLRWDYKNGRIWVRNCLKCGVIEKSIDTPPEEQIKKRETNIIKWLEVEMTK